MWEDDQWVILRNFLFSFTMSWLPLIHMLIEFSHYNLPSQSCKEHHITEGHGVPPLPAAPTSNPELCMLTECSGVASDSPNTCPAHPRCHVRACTPHFSSFSRSSYSSWQSCDTGFCKHSHSSSQEEYDLGAMCLHPSPAMRGGGWKNSTQGMDGFSIWGSAQS